MNEHKNSGDAFHESPPANVGRSGDWLNRAAAARAHAANGIRVTRFPARPFLDRSRRSRRCPRERVPLIRRNEAADRRRERIRVVRVKRQSGKPDGASADAYGAVPAG
ncbi:hypothetical protein Bcep18194_C7139 [Burkholderia lata]|uniref:Uncharacterized protein n=1 Tax=Burkholderia lata (strain ATCC 17760 / DSM 23089 / LMG 22485 / NCIMB 9086 / R18194 / 383) TaxID=482957 RepID=Q39MY3_BURL3|nr:hypothetical protein Bcep18194_C7139 [Burkholderia lata]